MMSLPMSNLAPELVGVVLGYVDDVNDLTQCARVSQIFLAETVPFLYRELISRRVDSVSAPDSKTVDLHSVYGYELCPTGTG